MSEHTATPGAATQAAPGALPGGLEPIAVGRQVAANIRAERARAGANQERLAGQMRALGFDAWIRQTVGAVERGRRRVTVDELFGLAQTLETSVPKLLDGLI